MQIEKKQMEQLSLQKRQEEELLNYKLKLNDKPELVQKHKERQKQLTDESRISQQSANRKTEDAF